jgi:hypothetical protein
LPGKAYSELTQAAVYRAVNRIAELKRGIHPDTCATTRSPANRLTSKAIIISTAGNAT